MNNRVLALVPASSHLDARLLDALRRTKIRYLQVIGCSDLPRARSRLLADGMKTGAETFLFIDSDVVPTAEDIIRLIDSPKLSADSAVSGCYLARTNHVAAVPLDSPELHIGGEPRFVRGIVAGMGFAAVTRPLVERMNQAEPVVRDSTGELWNPLFLPFVMQIEHEGESLREYVPEDYSFWWRLRAAGGTLWLDTHLCVGHVKPTVLMP